MTEEKTIQIISFDSPHPPKYGGVIDVYYKIKALYRLGYKIHLHCFVDTIPEDISVLNEFVVSIYYYKNKKTINLFFSFLPFSVRYRESKELVLNVNKSNSPIIFESLKTTIGVKRGVFFQKKILRLHNIEHSYFLGIAKSESNLFLRILFYIESLKYKKYESVIEKFDAISTLSNYETNHVIQKFEKAIYTPLFHGNESVRNLSEFGNYVIYSGDLKTADNRKALLLLLEIFKELKQFNLVIAASDREAWVQKLIKDVNNISFVKLIDFKHLQELLAHAHINIMVSFQKSGTKLKLINALYNSRHCLINANIVDDTQILTLCKLAKTKQDFITEIISLSKQPYCDFEKRKAILNEIYSDEKNALSLINTIENLK